MHDAAAAAQWRFQSFECCDREGEKRAFVQVEDHSGRFEAVLYNETLNEYAALLFEVRKRHSSEASRLIAGFRPSWYASAMALSDEHVGSIKQQAEQTLAPTRSR